MQGYAPFVDKLIEPILVAIFGSIFAITCLQVFFRYVLNDPFIWADELIRYLLVWGTMLGAASALARGGHIAIDALILRLPARWTIWATRLVWIIVASFSAFLTVYGAILIARMGMSVSPALGLPMYVPYAAVPIGAALWTLVSLRALARSFASTLPDGTR